MFKKHSGLTYFILIVILSLGVYLTKDLPAGEENKMIDSDGLLLTFVDVGQGDATFLRTIGGETWLVDGGEDDMYEAELLPFLNSQGVDKLDYAVVTHYHNDHMGGIFQLLKSGRIKNLILPDYTPRSKAKSGLLKNAEGSHTAVLDVSAGDVLETSDKNLKIAVLHPEKGGFDIDNENSNSLLLRLDYFDNSVLLTGDLEEDAEETLLGRYNLEVDILKVGHHGSGTSTSKAFLDEADPTYAVISAGEGNSYGHPHNKILNRLEDDDVMLYRTDLDGDVTFVLGEQGIGKISTETNYAKE